MHRQAVFDRCRRHVLALAGLEDLLEPPGQAQIALGVLLALVASAQEAVLREGLGGLLRLLEIAQHGRAAAHQHLTGFVDANVHLRARLADPARPVLARQGNMGVTAAFGHAVDLQHIQPKALVPVQQGQRHRRGTGQGNAQGIQAKSGEHLVPDPLADDWQAQEKIQALGRYLAVDPHLEPGPDARHTKQCGGPCALQVGKEGVEAFGKEHRLPGIDGRQLDKHPLGDMTEGQVRQQPVRLIQVEQLRAMSGRKPQGAKAVHHPLGQAGGAGGIDDSRQLIGAWRRVVLDR
ncbi:hypothetical protein D3C84_629910 [compost metagenome]